MRCKVKCDCFPQNKLSFCYAAKRLRRIGRCKFCDWLGIWMLGIAMLTWNCKSMLFPDAHLSCGCRVTSQIVQNFPDNNNNLPDNSPKRTTTSSHHRKVFREKFQDKSSTETANFRLNIPAKSAPSSGFSSPVCSPRRFSNAEYTTPTAQGPQAWSAPSVRSVDSMATSSPRISPEIYTGVTEQSTFSNSLRSPILMSKNSSAPPSPLHPKLFPENNMSRIEGNGNVSFHPLPRPPGAINSMQTSIVNQSAPKVEMPSVAGQWQKGRLLGSGTFGCVYEATNRYVSVFLFLVLSNLRMLLHVELWMQFTDINMQTNWSSLCNERSQHNSWWCEICRVFEAVRAG